MSRMPAGEPAGKGSALPPTRCCPTDGRIPSLHIYLCALIACILALAAVCAAPAPAAWASGLTLSSSCPEDGADAMPTSGRYWLRFSNNVASVESNLDLVTLTDDAGDELPDDAFETSLPDTEIEFGYRQYVYIDVDGLDAGATYHIVVQAGVEAKNGKTTDEAYDIEFTTAAAGEEPAELAEPEAQAAGTGSGDGTGGGSAADGDDSGTTSIDATPGAYASDDEEGLPPAAVAAMAAALALVVALLAVYWLRKRDRE